jgi:CheY-like chemotaxis protein
LQVTVDGDRVIQVFSNLLTNAAKYTEPGGHVTVGARAVDGSVGVAASSMAASELSSTIRIRPPGEHAFGISAVRLLDGYELAQRLRSTSAPAIRLIAVTGYGQQADRERTTRAGFEAHLVKPVDIAGLAATLDQLIR